MFGLIDIVESLVCNNVTYYDGKKALGFNNNNSKKVSNPKYLQII